MRQDRIINKGDIYRHFKNKLYQIVAIAYHSETREKYVVYQALYGDFKTYIRPYDMFMSEVDHVKYPDVKQKYRFEKVVLDEEGIVSRCEGSDDRKQEATEENYAGETLSIAGQTGKASDVMQDTADDESETNGVNPYLLEFLDKDSSKDRIEYINMIKNKVDNRLISDIAAALDITIEDGAPDDRFRQLITCLQTMARFECGRLR